MADLNLHLRYVAANSALVTFTDGAVLHRWYGCCMDGMGLAPLPSGPMLLLHPKFIFCAKPGSSWNGTAYLLLLDSGGQTTGNGIFIMLYLPAF